MENQPPRRTKVAIVEDDDDLRLLFSLWLNKDYETTIYSSGHELMAQIASDMPEVIILDFVMFGLNGVQVARSIRSCDSFAEIPLLFVTGHRFEDETVRSLEKAGAGYLSKPFTKREFLARLRFQSRQVPIADRLLTCVAFPQLTC